MAKQTPRQYLKELEEKNKGKGYYGTSNQFAILEENRIKDKSHKLLGKIFNGVLPLNERLEYNKIYNLLLDGVSEKNIINLYKS